MVAKRKIRFNDYTHAPNTHTTRGRDNFEQNQKKETLYEQIRAFLADSLFEKF